MKDSVIVIRITDGTDRNNAAKDNFSLNYEQTECFHWNFVGFLKDKA